jgi:NAD(P)-dependent dehydrogenase (short-subunit alcohol dehydrogenase family)
LGKTKKIVVIGATGHFGGRICRRIVGEKNTELVVTSRSDARARLFADELRELDPDATVHAASLNQSSPDFESALNILRPDIVVHTAGPYQDQDYRVAKACIDCGSHYIDLADGREFVQEFETLHREAKERGVLLVSGASTLPGLSSAVVDLLKDRFDLIRDIEISIAPAHQTPRGVSTIAAVLSYCGKPFKVLLNGDWVTMHGWQNMKTQRYPQLGLRISAACDVPDLGLLPNYVAGSTTVTFHAALEARWEQAALWFMGWLTRLRIVKNWNRLVPAFRWMSGRLIGLGSDTGGMHVKLSGIGRDQNAKSVTWFLMARQNHGPEIPCCPALILTRKLASDQISVRGAFPCLGMITMAEFDHEVSDLDIDWEIDESG